MQQEVRSGDVLMLRFKYTTTLDLDTRKDSVRINQLYEQIRLSILTDDSELTLDEAVVSAGIMYQVNSQAAVPQISNMSAASVDGSSAAGTAETDIESELNNLQLELEANSGNSSPTKQNLNREPMLANIVKVSRLWKSIQFPSRSSLVNVKLCWMLQEERF